MIKNANKPYTKEIMDEDFSNADLSELIIQDIDFISVSFENCNLSNTKFINCGFGGVSFYNCTLDNTSFDVINGGFSISGNAPEAKLRKLDLQAIKKLSKSMRKIENDLS